MKRIQNKNWLPCKQMAINHMRVVELAETNFEEHWSGLTWKDLAAFFPDAYKTLFRPCQNFNLEETCTLWGDPSHSERTTLTLRRPMGSPVLGLRSPSAKAFTLYAYWSPACCRWSALCCTLTQLVKICKLSSHILSHICRPLLRFSSIFWKFHCAFPASQLLALCVFSLHFPD